MVDLVQVFERADDEVEAGGVGAYAEVLVPGLPYFLLGGLPLFYYLLNVVGFDFAFL